MPDPVTEQERAAIERFRRERGVTRVPRGVSAYRMIYDPATKAIRYADRDMAMRASGALRRKSGRRGTSPEVAQRRLKVRELAVQGQSASQIAEVLGVSMGVVYSDCRQAGITLAAPAPSAPKPATAAPAEPAVRKRAARRTQNPRGPLTKPAEMEKRRAQVAEMAAQGMTKPEIVKALGTTIGIVISDCRALGITLPPAVKKRSDAVTERLERMAEMIAAGMSGPEMAAELGIAIQTVYANCKMAGLSISRRTGAR